MLLAEFELDYFGSADHNAVVPSILFQLCLWISKSAAHLIVIKWLLKVSQERHEGAQL